VKYKLKFVNFLKKNSSLTKTSGLPFFFRICVLDVDEVYCVTFVVWVFSATTSFSGAPNEMAAHQMAKKHTGQCVVLILGPVPPFVCVTICVRAYYVIPGDVDVVCINGKTVELCCGGNGFEFYLP
jgi:hypothetical protein